MTEHELLRSNTAAYVLGGLSGDDRTEFEAHLATCERCRAEVVEFAPIPALLATIDLDDLVGDDVVGSDNTAMADQVVAAARADLDRLRSSRRRWRAGTAVIGAAAVVALLVAAPWFDNDTPLVINETDRISLAIDATDPDAVAGDIAVTERMWGTYVHVSLHELPERDLYRLWTVDESGVWHEAGTWLPTPGRVARLGASTHLRLDQIALVVVTSDDRNDQLLTAR